MAVACIALADPAAAARNQEKSAEVKKSVCQTGQGAAGSKPENSMEKLQLPGTLRAENVANILATGEGKISRLLVHEGDRVQANQVVAMLSSLLREDIINSARLLVQAKKDELAKDPNNLKLQQELKRAQQDYQFALQQYKENPVTSPIDGVVSRRWVDLGDMVPAKTKLFEIQSSAKLRVDVHVSELDIRKLEIGQSAEIHADACPEKFFKGIVQRIYPQVDSQTRNGMVEIQLKKPCPNLKAGMFVQATFVTRTLARHHCDSRTMRLLSALKTRPVSSSKNGKAEEKVALVTGIGGRMAGWRFVPGVSLSGDQLVVEGQQELKTGTAVKIQGNV
ncbi:MAG: efflux RND transporter periplasmic adaptor subunit [Candidatus Krumholzibacteriota bacterium]|nr:efflux RND transporter periplasmic adaptor subunit [Candidatus Krumholzibacteriota bacterium]